MAERYERFRLETGARGPQVVLDQRRNAVGNIIIGAAIAITGYFGRLEISGVLIGIGIFWAALASLALRSRRVLVLGEPLEYADGGKTRTLSRREVALLRVFRKHSENRNSRPPLPWAVEIRGEDGRTQFVEFRFTSEAAARRFAERVGQVLGVAPGSA